MRRESADVKKTPLARLEPDSLAQVVAERFTACFADHRRAAPGHHGTPMQRQREHGADHLIDTGAEDVRVRIKEIARGQGKQGAEVVFDPVGGDLFEASLRAVAWGARLIVIGFAAGKVQQIPANILLVKNVSAIGYYWGSYRARAPERVASGYAQLFEWFADGKLRPHVSHQLDLAEAGAALELLKSRKSTGKVVLTTGRNTKGP